MTRRYIAIVTLLLIAAAVVVALHERQSVSLPVVPMPQTPGEVRVKAVERKTVAVESSNVEAAKPALRRTSGISPVFI